MVWSPYGRFACGITEVEWLRTAGQVSIRRVHWGGLSAPGAG